MSAPRLRKWPFPGDSPIARARKVALAYRTSAQAQEEKLTALREALKHVDLRLLEYDNLPSTDVIRDALKDDPGVQSVADLDKRFTGWGETWHCPRPATYDDDDYIDAVAAADILQISSGAVHKLRLRGRLKGIWNDSLGSTGGWVFLVRDLYQLSQERRPRNNDTKADSGEPQAG